MRRNFPVFWKRWKRSDPGFSVWKMNGRLRVGDGAGLKPGLWWGWGRGTPAGLASLQPFASRQLRPKIFVLLRPWVRDTQRFGSCWDWRFR